MIANGKALYNFIDTLLIKEGYQLKKTTWYKNTVECIPFFHVQKNYGGQYENVLGFFIKELNKTGMQFPVFYKCDLKVGLDKFADNDLIDRALNLENMEFKGDEREFLIRELCELYLFPILSEFETFAGIQRVVGKYEDLIHCIKIDARKKLNLEISDN